MSTAVTTEQQLERYRRIYAAGSDVWLYPRTAGLHAVLLDFLEGHLAGKRVLDVGCGAGRMSLYCARVARDVVGVDFESQAVDLASVGAELCGLENVKFEAGEATEAQGSFDTILLVGVAEHLPEVVPVLRKLKARLNPGGQMLLACPGFSNLRGWSYQTIGRLFGWPMSLADLRQVDLPMVERWAIELGLRLDRVAGALYEGVWGESAVTDMLKRTPNAARDAKHPGPLNLDAYRSWLSEESRVARAMLEQWKKQGWVRLAKPPAPLPVRIPTVLDPAISNKLRAYLSLDQAGDLSWSDTPPVNRLGGEGIYVLRS
ncbi:MAG: methyltransferase domain-containing protein [Planctomycetes bacterium]|nr:methyltransferase domain-containing protein [Planctomycetota bacterium]